MTEPARASAPEHTRFVVRMSVVVRMDGQPIFDDAGSGASAAKARLYFKLRDGQLDGGSNPFRSPAAPSSMPPPGSVTAAHARRSWDGPPVR